MAAAGMARTSGAGAARPCPSSHRCSAGPQQRRWVARRSTERPGGDGAAALDGSEPPPPPAASAGGAATDTLASLDALVGGDAAGTKQQQQQQQQKEQQEQPEGVEVRGWWDRPLSANQTSAPRRNVTNALNGNTYLDSERITRDPLELNVGELTVLGERLALPEAPRPYVSRALAAVAAAAGLAAAVGAPPPLALDVLSVIEGARWQLLTAALQPVSLLDAAATAAVLATAGTYAERRLGSLCFSAAFLSAGAAAATCWYGAWAVDLEGTSLMAMGASAAALGPAAALAGPFLLGNWRLLNGSQRAACAGSAAALAALLVPGLGAEVTGTPLDDALSGPIHCLSAAVGAGLGAAAGPQLQEQRELDIAEGSMTIDGEYEELSVVIDRRTLPQRLAATGAAALLLLGLLAVADQLVLTGAALELLASWDTPAVQAALFEEVGPDLWELNA